MAWIEHLFDRLAMAYGSEKMQALWRGQDLAAVKQFWAERLAAFTGEELRSGFDRLEAAHPSWPPSLPEFVALCRPPVAAVNHEAAFYEAARGIEVRKRGEMGTWSNPAVYWAMIDVSAFDVSGQPWPNMKARWTRALDARLSDPNLPAIPEPPKALPSPRAESEVKDARFDDLTKQLTGTHHMRAWADKIKERHANGDKTIPLIALRMANDAERIAAGGAVRA